jgi:hypothetical protein
LVLSNPVSQQLQSVNMPVEQTPISTLARSRQYTSPLEIIPPQSNSGLASGLSYIFGGQFKKLDEPPLTFPYLELTAN